MEKTTYNIFTEEFKERKMPTHEELLKEFQNVEGIMTDSLGNIEIGKVLTEEEKTKLINITKKEAVKS